MEITDSDGRALSSVHLALTDAEARELIEALTQLAEAAKGWHAHVGDPEFSTEVTIYRADDESARFEGRS